MNKQKKILFNLTEIVLAIIIIAVGTVSVMTLFPSGLSENKKAIVQSNAAHSAETIFAYISNNISKDYNQWISFLNKTPSNKPNPVLTGQESLDLITGTIYDYSPENGIYAVKLKTGTHTDMIGEVLVWTQQVSDAYFGGELINAGTGLDTDATVGINIELSFPLGKPYDQREKFQYYFEAYNKSINTEDEGGSQGEGEDQGEGGGQDESLFEEDEGVVTVNYKSTLSVEVLGTFFAYSNGEKAKVFLELEVTKPDGTVVKSSPFNNGGRVYGEKADTPVVYTEEVESGTKFRISAKGQCLYYHTVYGPYWSDNSMQADALLDGQVPYPYTPAGSQPPFTDFIGEYLNKETGEVTIEDHEVLYLFELNSVPRNHSSYDMQDLVVIAGIEKIAITPEEAAAREVMVAAQNVLNTAQQVLNSAEAEKNSKLADLNIAKNSYNYNELKRIRDQKYNIWQNAIRRYNNSYYWKNYYKRQMDRAEGKYLTAQANLDNAGPLLAAYHEEYDNALATYNAALIVYNEALNTYNAAVEAMRAYY